MNNRLTLRDLIKCSEGFLMGGDRYFTGDRFPVFTELVKKSLRTGLDVAELLRGSLPLLESLERAVRQSRERWLGVALRLFGVLLLVAACRVYLLSEVSDGVFQSWIFLDRVCGGIAVLAAVIVGRLGIGFYERSSWSPDRDKRLYYWFGDYLILRDAGGHVPELSAPLREIRLAELTDGVDGQGARKRLYLRDLTHELDVFKRLSPRINYVSILAEWGAFFCAALGFALIPFLAWIEASAGE